MNGPGATRRDPVRHDLLRLTGDGWDAVAMRFPGTASMAGLRLWAARGLPVMRRRFQPGDRPDLVPVAVALPLAHGRARLGFQVAAADIASIDRSPALRDAADGLPDRLRERTDAVLSLAGGLMPRMFGSAMWQHVTGLPYLCQDSDLDLLWEVPPLPGRVETIARLVSSLLALDATPGPRLDGEIVLENSRAANWRELAPGGPDELLVKTGDSVTLMSRTDFLRQE